ncbi:heart- and neural crest derivatives-expressed protein 2 [Sitodiplosis mosellana]|uniref:heart- and neural crest derivatives-expressed protein 2 n=1 Tax=Sitodiplosis mosellana TaxID=263140 RepID=UPI002444AFE2|nr:heart- and neural crest derivatives-expressed protein 2 [Sitodiplosis mosellana]
MSHANYNTQNIPCFPPYFNTQNEQEEFYWNSSPCSTDSAYNYRELSPNVSNLPLDNRTNPHRIIFNSQTDTIFKTDPNIPSDENYNRFYYDGTTTKNDGTTMPFTRMPKRRTTANKKERRRTQSINTSFAQLRDCIPNVPSDTKLSKIKTLRLATSYINHLNGVLRGDQDPSIGFRAELVPSSRKINAERRAKLEAQTLLTEPRRNKGRTGWPQHVWASELKASDD